MKISNFSSLLFSIIVLSCLSCSNKQQEQAEKNHLGELHFKVTGSPEALPHFEEGLLLLHSFEFQDARTAFQKARELDSNFIMAYWGEAMTYNHPLWRAQDYQKGRAVLDSVATRADAILKEKGTEIEQHLWKSLEILYAREGDKNARDKAYSAYLADLYQKYPDNHEVAAFYALSILAAVPVGRDDKEYEKGANIVKGILEENPKHPGALHYLIHSYDDPAHAQLALNAAFNYSKVAPDAAHALHMPSHIFVALGMWDEVVSSNIASWEASVNRMQRMDLDNDELNYHALHWLMYGYLQQGKYEAARKILKNMVVYSDTLPSERARSHVVDMKGSYLAESGDWESELADISVSLDELNIESRAEFAFMEGMKAFTNKDQTKLRKIIKTMESDRENAAAFVTDSKTPMCGSGSSRYEPNQQDIDHAHIFEMQLRGLDAQLKNNVSETEKWLKSACELQENTSYSYGPPTIIKPTFELYADWLVTQNRAKEALVQYEKAWERGPNRVAILTGKIKAYQNLEDKENLESTKKLLADIWKTADPSVKSNFLKKEQLSDKSL